MVTFKSTPRGATPKSRHAMEEFGPGKKQLLSCKVCGCVYYKKSWHHNNLKLKTNNLKLALCPACQMIKNRQYEGKILIKKIPLEKEKELINLIKNFCQTAFSIDPMHRLIAVKKQENNLIITLTENELANKLGKKIRDVFKKVKTKTSFVGDPSDVAIVAVEFL